MTTGMVTLERAGEVWTVSLARPDKRNALSAELVEALLEVVQRAPAEGAAVLVLRGPAGTSARLRSIPRRPTISKAISSAVRAPRVLLQALGASTPCLTVALAHGRTSSGVDLVAAFRLRYASADATYRNPG